MKTVNYLKVLLSSLLTVRIHSEFVKYAPFYEEYDFHFVEHIGVFHNVSIGHCILRCQGLDMCVYVGFSDTTSQCHLHGLEASKAVGGSRTHYAKWTNATEYLFAENSINLKTGAVAWQSTTWMNSSASLAIDGEYSQLYIPGSQCTHTSTQYSFWAMEFELSSTVISVDLYLRSDHLDRNTNFTLTISRTMEDFDNGVGEECGRYFGSVVSMLEIRCPYPIYGKILKVQHEMASALTICEIDVFSI